MMKSPATSPVGSSGASSSHAAGASKFSTLSTEPLIIGRAQGTPLLPSSFSRETDRKCGDGPGSPQCSHEVEDQRVCVNASNEKPNSLPIEAEEMPRSGVQASVYTTQQGISFFEAHSALDESSCASSPFGDSPSIDALVEDAANARGTPSHSCAGRKGRPVDPPGALSGGKEDKMTRGQNAEGTAGLLPVEDHFAAPVVNSVPNPCVDTRGRRRVDALDYGTAAYGVEMWDSSEEKELPTEKHRPLFSVDADHHGATTQSQRTTAQESVPFSANMKDRRKPPTCELRRADSLQWVASRQTALAQLQAQFRNTSPMSGTPAATTEAKLSPLASRRRYVTPREPKKSPRCSPDASPLAPSRPPADEPVTSSNDARTAVSILNELLGCGTSGACGAEGEHMSFLNAAEMPQQAMRDSEDSVFHFDISSSPTESAPSRMMGSRLVVRPSLDVDVTGISPIKNEASSRLVDSCLTPVEKSSEIRPREPTATAVGDSPPSFANCLRGEPRQGVHGTLQDPREELTTLSSPSATKRSSSTRVTPGVTQVQHRAQVPHAASSSASLIAQDLQLPRRSPRSLDIPLSERVRTPPEGYAEVSHVGDTSLLSPSATVLGLPTTSRDALDAHLPASRPGAETASHSNGEQRNEKAPVSRLVKRQDRLREEMRANEMAECTFHPVLSPGTRAMVQLVQEREMERTLEENAAIQESGRIQSPSASASPAADPSILQATLRRVFERLYPAELSASASRRRIIDQEMEYRRLAREELILLRRRCDAARRTVRSPHGRAESPRDTFNAFLSVILRTGAESAQYATTQTAKDVVQTSYKSPMAIALLKERDAKRKYHTRREAEMQMQMIDGAETHTHDTNVVDANASGEGIRTEESFRVALFDEFLLRQNAYYLNRSRTVRELEREMTPSFTPQTTNNSMRLVRKMISRSLLNESLGPETSSIVAQRERQRVPFTASLVKQHTSPYVDPCTFHPCISPAAREAKAEEQLRRHTSKRPLEEHRTSFFERLHKDHERIAHRREVAKQQAEVEALKGLSFRPQLNDSHNTHVQSMLSTKNYSPCLRYLQKKHELLEAKRTQQEEAARKAEEEACTFHPKIRKQPAYISKMAESFGLLRQQDVEL